MIEIEESIIPEEKSLVFQNLNAYNWIIFTSGNGVKFFFKKLETIGLRNQLNPELQFAVIGEKTAKELENSGFKVKYISQGSTSDLFLEELKSGVLKAEDRVLLALGNRAGTTLEKGLSSFLTVHRLDVYETKPVLDYSKEILSQILADTYDLIIFTSPSGVERLVEIMGKGPLPKLKAACIGKTTEKALLKFGITPLLTSSKSEGKSFAEEIINYLLKY